MMQQFRFPGLRSFHESEKSLFYGRAMEFRDLERILNLEKILIINGPPGSGKTSLINTIFSEKKWNNWRKYFIDFDPMEDKISFSEKLSGTLDTPNSNNAIINSIWLDDLAREHNINLKSLWLKLKKTIAISDSGKTHFCIIFDHFEQISTWPRNTIELFKRELDEVLSGKAPSSLQDGLLRNEQILPDDKIEFLLSPISIKVLFVVRSDSLHLLQIIKDIIPSIFRNIFLLEFLKPEQAVVALECPAKIEGTFTSPPFQFSQQALISIVNSLTDSNGKISPAQLQIIAQAIEADVISRRLKTVIEEEDVENIKGVISDFFEREINKLDFDEQLIARTMIEDQLILEDENGSLSRLAVHETSLINNSKISKELLHKLLELHLLRANFIHGSIYYEIAHDALLQPIQKSRLERLERKKYEERLLLELKLREEQERRKKAEEERMIAEEERMRSENLQRLLIKSRRKFQILVIAFILVLIFLYTVYKF